MGAVAIHNEFESGAQPPEWLTGSGHGDHCPFGFKRF
jgi:hypothetical protein